MEVEERYWSKVDQSAGPSSCWPWSAAVNKVTGYGVFHPEHGQTVSAHRYGARLAGLIDERDERVVDHTCHNGAGCPPGPCPHRLCQNPAHYEAVANQVNVNRSHNANSQKTKCPKGHPYTQKNTRLQVRATTTSRHCITCARETGH